MAIVPTQRATNRALAANDPTGDVQFICDQCKTPMGKSFYPVHTVGSRVRKPYKFCPVCGAPAGNYVQRAEEYERTRRRVPKGARRAQAATKRVRRANEPEDTQDMENKGVSDDLT